MASWRREAARHEGARAFRKSWGGCTVVKAWVRLLGTRGASFSEDGAVRHRYLVAYDVSDPVRLRRVHKKLLGFGDPLQYSVFQCNLSDVEKLRLVEELSGLIHHEEDRVLIVDIGPVEGRAAVAFEFLGVRTELAAERQAVIV